jgi:hypothetical protein
VLESVVLRPDENVKAKHALEQGGICEGDVLAGVFGQADPDHGI